MRAISSTIYWSLALCVLVSTASAQRLLPITDLGGAADSIVLASVELVNAPRGTSVSDASVKLKVLQSLKGSLDSGLVDVSILTLDQKNSGPLTISNDFVGKRGLWFLRLVDGKYRILARAQFAYSSEELFLPVAESRIETGTQSLDALLLRCHVHWYLALPDPSWVVDNMLLSSFLKWHAGSPTEPQVSAAVLPLIQSPVIPHRIVGLTAAIRAGSLPAMNLFVDSLSELRGDPKFPMLLLVLSMYAKDEKWLRPLERLIAVSAPLDVPGMDAAVAGALSRIGTKGAMAMMAKMLDSKDPQAQLAAASYFSNFTFFADKVLAPVQSARIFAGFAVEKSADLAVATHYSDGAACDIYGVFMIRDRGGRRSADSPPSCAVNRNGNSRTPGEFGVRPDRFDGEIAFIGAVDLAR